MILKNEYASLIPCCAACLSSNSSQPLPRHGGAAHGKFRLLVPPHADNEEAADFLRTQIGRHDNTLEWRVVRSDTLTNDTEAIGYEVFRSPVCSAIFDPGRTSRLNVARFMADLLTDEDTSNRWHGQIPVIYGKT